MPAVRANASRSTLVGSPPGANFVITGWHQVPGPLMIFLSNSKFDQSLKCSGFKCALPIRTKFCTGHDSVTVQNFVVIGWAYFKLERSKFLSNSKFDWNTVSGTGSRAYHYDGTACSDDKVGMDLWPIRATLVFRGFAGAPIVQKSHNAPVLYPTMHHFETEMCTCVHISVTKLYNVGYLSDAFGDLWNGLGASVNLPQPFYT